MRGRAAASTVETCWCLQRPKASAQILGFRGQTRTRLPWPPLSLLALTPDSGDPIKHSFLSGASSQGPRPFTAGVYFFLLLESLGQMEKRS